MAAWAYDRAPYKGKCKLSQRRVLISCRPAAAKATTPRRRAKTRSFADLHARLSSGHRSAPPQKLNAIPVEMIG